MIIPLIRNYINVINPFVITRAMHKQLDPNSSYVKALLNDDVVWLCNLFLKKGFEIRVVGGAVRDMLMQRKAKDIDLSTTATPDEMIKVFQQSNVRYIETGLQHGTLTAHINKNDFEVTTLRIDVETYGRLAKVEFTHDWRLDALRRDLTFNAMSMDINAMLYDYFDGETDLKNGKVRFVGDAECRIKEDYLRILRYFRFYGRIAPDIHQHESVTLNNIKKLAAGLKQIAVERIWVEMSKILTGGHAPHLVKLIYDLGVAENIALPACEEKHFTEFEKVWTDTRGVQPHPVSLLVTLVDTANQAEQLAIKWKLSTNEKNLACFIASHRYQTVAERIDSSEAVFKHASLKYYQDILVRKCNPKNTVLIKDQVRELLHYEGKTTESELIAKWTVPKFPITGADLKKKGVKQGPDMGRILNKLKDLWIESYYTLTKDYLLEKVDVYG